MTTDKQREAFEAHFIGKFPRWQKKRGDSGDYINIKASIAWKAWQAALASPEVQKLVEAAREMYGHAENVNGAYLEKWREALQPFTQKKEATDGK